MHRIYLISIRCRSKPFGPFLGVLICWGILNIASTIVMMDTGTAAVNRGEVFDKILTIGGQSLKMLLLLLLLQTSCTAGRGLDVVKLRRYGAGRRQALLPV